MSTSIKRIYGKERIIGNVFYSEETKETSMVIDLGFFGKQYFGLKKNDDGSFQITKTVLNKTDNSTKEYSFGKLFPVQNKEGQVVEGIHRGTLGLFSEYNKELQKNITNSHDALFITTLKLKEKVKVGDTGNFKIGFVKGVFGIEENTGDSTQSQDIPPHVDIKDLDISIGEIPF